MKKKKLYFLRAVLLVLTAALLVTIFMLSADTGSESDVRSEGATDISTVFVAWLGQYITIDDPDALQFSLYIGLRKAAHMCEYACLAVLVSLLVWTWTDSKPRRVLLPLAAAVCYAATDEWHQTFVPGRSGEIRDVLVDTIGALAGLAALFFFLFIFHKIRIQYGKETEL